MPGLLGNLPCTSADSSHLPLPAAVDQVSNEAQDLSTRAQEAEQAAAQAALASLASTTRLAAALDAVRTAEAARSAQQEALVSAERQAGEARGEAERVRSELVAAEEAAQELLEMNTRLEAQVWMDSCVCFFCMNCTRHEVRVGGLSAASMSDFEGGWRYRSSVWSRGC